MKRVLKRVFIVCLCIPLLLAGILTLLFLIYPAPELSHEKLEKKVGKICFYDQFKNQIDSFAFKEYGGNANFDKLPDHLKNAFIAVEDKRFFKHNGIDFKSIIRAVKSNLFSRSLKQGGSTISQQLIKNTHLTPEKTFNRKLKELKLTLKLEKRYNKQSILKFYLNSIYFGNGCYGIESASLYYFGKHAHELTLEESASLAGTVKSPSVFNPEKQQCKARRNLVLTLMKQQGYISENECENACKSDIKLHLSKRESYLSLALEEAFEKLQISPYFSGELNIYTHFNQETQTLLNNALSDINYNKKAFVLDKNGHVLALYLNAEDFERAPASLIKPLLCYAPAFESGKINPLTKILDEKCDFNGYSPANYGNKYHGYISVEQAIANSLNVPAVKVLQTVGIKNAKKYLEKTGIKIQENSLNIALGSYQGGVKLLDLCTAYTTFLNGGNCINASLVKRVDLNGKTVYISTDNKVKIFRAGTCDLINQTLKTCAKSGTAKCLSNCDYEICAKTGTNGNSNGNTDAYSLCYTSENLFAVWLGNADSSLMPNEITGAYCAKIINGILQYFYKNTKPNPFEISNDVTQVQLCKLAYENNKIMLSDKNTPERFKFSAYFLKGYEPTSYSDEYSHPTLSNYNLFVNGDEVLIKVEKNDHVYFEVLRRDENGKIASFECLSENFYDKQLKNGKYTYQITPFIKNSSGEKIYGDTINLPQVKIQNDGWFENYDWIND